MASKRLIQCMVIFTISSSVCNAVHASNREAEEDAIKKSIEAAYKQSGLEENINKIIDRKVPKEYRDMAAKIAPIVKMVANQEVEYKWEF